MSEIPSGAAHARPRTTRSIRSEVRAQSIWVTLLLAAFAAMLIDRFVRDLYQETGYHVSGLMTLCLLACIGVVIVRRAMLVRRIVRSVRQISGQAAALGRGETVRRVETDFAEIDELSDILFDASTRQSELLAHEKLLVQEVEHRGRNLLASVLALAKGTFRTSATLTEADEELAGRLAALGRSTTLLHKGGEYCTTLCELLEHSLEPVLSCVARDGPQVTLEGKVAQEVGLVLHETSQNAIKYGALRDLGGRVAISWTVEGGRVWLAWTESGGLPGAKEPRRGFGSVLIERVCKSLGTSYERDFAPDGARIRFDFPSLQ